MMTMLFTLMLVATVLVWKGWRRSALTCFAITLLLATILFYADITAHLTISL